MSERWATVFRLRGPITASGIVVVLYGAVPQITEAVRNIAIEWPSSWLLALLAVVTLIGASLTVGHCARVLLASRETWHRTWLVAALSSIPTLSAALALWLAARGPEMRPFPEAKLSLRIAAAATLAFGGLLFKRSLVSRTNTSLHKGVVSSAAALLTYAAVAGSVSHAWLGTLAIVHVFVFVFAIVMSLLTIWASATRIPILGCLLGLSVLFGALQLNDNHEVRHTHRPNPHSTWLDQAYLDWFRLRRDADAFDRYPVYVVATAGGGIYAAYYSATVLARLQDRCPAFAQHVFAISGVSGGSVGGAVFAALAKSHVGQVGKAPCVSESPEADSFEQDVDRVLSTDFLAQLAWATLFPDLLQRVLPFRVDRWDRSRALEFAFEEAWSSTGRGAANPLASSFADSWDASGAAPALLFNTTEVVSGSRLLIAPFLLGSSLGSTLGLFDLRRDIDLNLSTAAVLSARFPYVTPAGWLRTDPPNDFKRLIVDGGYLDNSGVTTAHELHTSLVRLNEEYGLPAQVFVIHIGSPPGTDADNWVLEELTAPLQTLLSAREARARLAVSHAEFLLNGKRIEQAEPEPFRQFFLDGGRSDLPLGWSLAESSRRIIRDQAGDAARCRWTESMNVVALNDCLAHKIHRELSTFRSP